MNVIKLSALASIVSAFTLLGCGGGDGEQTASVSFYVSDAPVDKASSVSISFSMVELVDDEGNSFFLDVIPSTGLDYQTVDLMEYQGENSQLIVSTQPVPVGSYKELILHVTNENGVNYVIDENGQQPLKQPSNKLKLGSFDVTSEAVQLYTIEFDLRQSLVMRGNLGSNNGYILKPHGVSIVSNASAVSISGNVDDNLLTGDESCTADSQAFIYLYEGEGHDSANLIDLVDEDDPEFDSQNPVPENAVKPIASAGLDENNNYAFGFLNAGTYTVAFSCNAGDDNPIQYDGTAIPLPTGQVGTTTLAAGENGTIDFVPAP
ncbi:DUF4382 domain-containing protein [Vibrio vulnificus]|uniref:DUF4382 domain-containing protein n=1 Tax=Vibrio vulnificus TaxID=672 RepID=UPI00102CCBF7|nr:DUF4382 domain-containing protein [Vibrio vulnificus]EGR0788546.1 DUF4382 domain-containing protein [Vibrio vulnificus]EGR0796865.1 DUF4382 domain-containing protein [Vibrio vulnificus]EGR0814672.1 DUF4382 domain-containing protein [Vibrio vulnificus]EGR0827547.1 DUF4382 domain-containing protein [Vibrio vulnificus]EGR0847789.1 DUF4382 domain-containing protein [Vibrio vulnificus]